MVHTFWTQINFVCLTTTGLRIRAGVKQFQCTNEEYRDCKLGFIFS